MPDLPDGLVLELAPKDVPKHADSVTLRLHVPKSFVSVERWKAFKARPVEGTKEWLGKMKCHSVYGWRERTQKNWKGDEEIFVCGYMKLQRDVVASVLQLSGRHGVFVDRLAKDQVQRPNVSWMDRNGQSHAAYYNAVCEAAKEKACSVAFRVGGGNNLGLRLQNVVPEHVVGVWRVSGVPLERSDEGLRACCCCCCC